MHSLLRSISSPGSRFARICSHMASAKNLSEHPHREIRIPVPWGHIAAKEWGDSNGIPVLGLHGWQDNCGTFDTLIPLLPADLHIVAVDLPGHGLSSRKPPGMLYHLFDWITDVRRVIDHLQWKKYSLLAHSMGAGIAMGYAAVYPDEVEKVVGLDGIKPAVYPIDGLPKQIAKGIRQLWRCEERMAQPPRPISVEDAVELLVDAMRGAITEESAQVLLKRGATPMADDPGRLIFNRDPRLKVTSIPGVTDEQLMSLSRNLSCDLLLILANEGIAFAFSPMEQLEAILEVYRQRCRSFRMVKVDGTHHVHLNNPERVAPYIKEFLVS